MKATTRSWRYLATPLIFVGMVSISSAAELNPAAVIYKLPDQTPWGPINAAGAQSAVVVGDPTKPGFYMVYNKWTKGNHFSRRTSTQRPLHRRAAGHVVGRLGAEIRSRQHDAAAGRQLCHPFRQAGALGRRQG